MLKTVAAWILSAALALVSWNALPQVVSEFRDTEPGSLLFGTLHLLICTTAAASAIGVVRRRRWAAWSIWACGISAAGLLAAQPLYESMADDAQQTIWLGAGLAGIAALGMGWMARRLATTAAASGPQDAHRAEVLPPAATRSAPQEKSRQETPSRSDP